MNKIAQRAMIFFYLAILTPPVMALLFVVRVCERVWESRSMFFYIWCDVKEDCQELTALWGEALKPSSQLEGIE